MVRQLKLLLSAVLFLISCLPYAFAHSPYFEQSERVVDQKFGDLQLKILKGDGIFFADPGRVVVLDDKGYLIAISPMSEALILNCEDDTSVSSCTAYDEINSKIYKPFYSEWRRTELLLDEDDSPQQYPELMKAEYGFETRPPAVFDIIYFEALGIIRSPIISLIAICWWSVFWLFALATPKGLIQKRRNRLPIGFVDILVWAVYLFLIGFMLISAAYGWLLAPYSIYFFLLVFLCGGFMAIQVRNWIGRH